MNQNFNISLKDILMCNGRKWKLIFIIQSPTSLSSLIFFPFYARIFENSHRKTSSSSIFVSTPLVENFFLLSNNLSMIYSKNLSQQESLDVSHGVSLEARGRCKRCNESIVNPRY